MEKDNSKKKEIGLEDNNITNDPLLDILREKDNLIVSLKEASTRRDKLNEKQIKILSEDNSKKTAYLNNLQIRLGTIDAKLNQKEAEFSLLKVTENKLTSKIEEFKLGFEKYKSSVRSSLDQIKISIQEELAKREEYKNQLLDNLKDNYLKLETQIQEVDNYYKEIIAEIAKKQGLAKKYIRHALNDLQESLSLLDMSHAEYIEPTHIKENFSKIVEDSSSLFQEVKDMKGLPQGSTIVKNIENVHIELGETPVIEGVFREISEITKVQREHIEKSAKSSLHSDGAQGAAGAAKIAEEAASSADADGKKKAKSKLEEKKSGTGDESGMGDGEKGEGAGAKSDTGDKGMAQTVEESKAASGKAGEKPSQAGQGDSGDSKAKSEKDGKDKSQDSGKGEGGGPTTASDDRIKGDIEEPKKKKFGEEIQEVIFKRGRNYAPFNWREILSDIQLTRFESFIESCIKAEKSGNYMKALGLYKTIQEQPGISDTIAGRLLDDHIEYLEDLIKRKYSFNYRPEEIKNR